MIHCTTKDFLRRHSSVSVVAHHICTLPKTMNKQTGQNPSFRALQWNLGPIFCPSNICGAHTVAYSVLCMEWNVGCQNSYKDLSGKCDLKILQFLSGKLWERKYLSLITNANHLFYVFIALLSCYPPTLLMCHQYSHENIVAIFEEERKKITKMFQNPQYF